MDDRHHLLVQLNKLIGEFDQLETKSRHSDLSDLPEKNLVRFNTRSLAAVERIAGTTSAYYRSISFAREKAHFPGDESVKVIGVVQSLRDDIEAGYLESQRELIHGEVFADFLEMASHLHREGYKDAAL